MYLKSTPSAIFGEETITRISEPSLLLGFFKREIALRMSALVTSDVSSKYRPLDPGLTSPDVSFNKSLPNAETYPCSSKHIEKRFTPSSTKFENTNESPSDFSKIFVMRENLQL